MTSPTTESRRLLRVDGRPAKGDLREQALVEAAEALLVSGGFADAPIAALAAEAGISRATFYFYFASKEALLASVLDRAVHGFNDRIVALFGPGSGTDAAETLAASVEAAAELWWRNAAVLCASVELGTRLSAVYERTQANFAVVGAPTSALLQRIGRVPEAADPQAADGLVLTLLLMSERAFYHLMRAEPTLERRRTTTGHLLAVWLRAFGLDREAAAPAFVE